MEKTKPFYISKHVVWDAYKSVRENQGSAGVDNESIEEFERNLKNNLYKIWNRMSSGSYFPSAVRLVEIPKDNGSKRPLGISTVTDRIAQTVIRMVLEPEIEPHFHNDSYGYRPGKSAIEAIGTARKRCWRFNWVIDIDIKSYFDEIDWGLLNKALQKHTDCQWIHLYIERGLRAPVQLPDGNLVSRDKGVAQGSCISPLLANLFLHYAFDEWMKRNYQSNPFERYCDDIIVHCKTEKEAILLKEFIEQRFLQCKLRLNPEKTRIVYCKDDDRKGAYLNESFDFLGYTFRPRRSEDQWGKHFINFTPAVSNKAAKKIRSEIRNWKLPRRSGKRLEDLSMMFNPVIRGWINYFSNFYKSALYPVLKYLNFKLASWAARKYKKLRRHMRRARHWLEKIAKRDPQLFAHWHLGVVPEAE